MFKINFGGGMIALGVFAILIWVLFRYLWLVGIVLILLGVLEWLFNRK